MRSCWMNNAHVTKDMNLLLQDEVLISKLVSIDRFSTGTVVVGEISSLAHEVSDDTVETWSGVSESLLTGTESTKVLSSLGHNISPQFHDNTAGSWSTDGDVEVNFGVGPAVKKNQREWSDESLRIMKMLAGDKKLHSWTKNSKSISSKYYPNNFPPHTWYLCTYRYSGITKAKIWTAQIERHSVWWRWPGFCSLGESMKIKSQPAAVIWHHQPLPSPPPPLPSSKGTYMMNR